MFDYRIHMLKKGANVTPIIIARENPGFGPKKQ